MHFHTSMLAISPIVIILAWVLRTSIAFTFHLKRNAVGNEAYYKEFRGSLCRSLSLDFLEASPYWNQSKIPLHTFTSKSPLPAKIIEVSSLSTPKDSGETCNVVIDHGGMLKFWEGQTIGVLPPGINAKNGKAHANRLYSVASTRYGDDIQGKTVTLCIKRVLENAEDRPPGVCSNFLCAARPGDEVHITGPAGKTMLLPEATPSADLILVATGTGIAPFRSFIRRLFVEDTPAARKFLGSVWLFHGACSFNSLLYNQEWRSVLERYPSRFRYDFALSREHQRKDGGKYYVQDKIKEHSSEIFERLMLGSHFYCCGLRGMMPGVLEVFRNEAALRKLDWESVSQEWKKEKRWHVEVY